MIYSRYGRKTYGFVPRLIYIHAYLPAQELGLFYYNKILGYPTGYSQHNTPNKW